MQIPSSLKKGDTVYLLNIARHGNCDTDFVTQTLTSWGLNVVWGDSIRNTGYCQFSAPAEVRLKDLQYALDRAEIKAIFFLRGGYGTVQILDALDFSEFLKAPKWLIGYSDITYLHSAMNRLRCASIHATMLSTWHITSKEDLNSLHSCLFDTNYSYRFECNEVLREQIVDGELVGGNLSIIHTQLGTQTDIETDQKILVLEDVYENLMSIERMLWALRRNGKFKNLKGLILGDFVIPIEGNETSNNIVEGIPEITQENAQVAFVQLIRNFFKEDSFPVFFGLPIGHVGGRNRALKLGAHVLLQYRNNGLEIKEKPV